MSTDPCWAWKCPKGHLTTTPTSKPPTCQAPRVERGKTVGLCDLAVEPFTLRRDTT